MDILKELLNQSGNGIILPKSNYCPTLINEEESDFNQNK
jgi:hypothetical protein